MKISELNTKSFLGGTGAAANSYVLINYEDNSTSEPVTYKASLQELGKAIANDLKLPSANVSGNTIIDFKVKGVSNGAYTEKAVGVLSNDGPSMGDVSVAVNTAINGLASTGYVTDAVDGLASTGYVTNAVYGLASTGYVTSAINDFVSMTDIVTEINDSTTTFGRTIYEYVTNNAGAGGGGFDPTESISCEFIPYGIDGSDPIEGSLYPVMTDGNALYNGDNNGVMTYFAPLNKILFYDVITSAGVTSALLLKDRDNNTIHTIQLN